MDRLLGTGHARQRKRHRGPVLAHLAEHTLPSTKYQVQNPGLHRQVFLLSLSLPQGPEQRTDPRRHHESSKEAQWRSGLSPKRRREAVHVKCQLFQSWEEATTPPFLFPWRRVPDSKAGGGGEGGKSQRKARLLRSSSKTPWVKERTRVCGFVVLFCLVSFCSCGNRDRGWGREGEVGESKKPCGTTWVPLGARLPFGEREKYE